ncbi:MAG: hypothetical protein FI716_02470 [SAR202 cluster bacterium]|nr:hypothetical protein [SAR202 cluster bacterium]
MTPKPFAVAFVTASVVAVLIVIVMVVLGEYTKTRGRFLITALVFEGYFFASLGPAWVAERRADSPVSRVALAAAVAALLLLLTGIWGTPNSDAFWKSTAIVMVLALVLAYAAVVDVQPGRLARSYQVKAVALATVIACFGIAADINWPPYWWVFTLTALVWVGALLVPPVGYLARRIQGR